jgi:hypothetical protein
MRHQCFALAPINDLLSPTSVTFSASARQAPSSAASAFSERSLRRAPGVYGPGKRKPQNMRRAAFNSLNEGLTCVERRTKQFCSGPYRRCFFPEALQEKSGTGHRYTMRNHTYRRWVHWYTLGKQSGTGHFCAGPTGAGSFPRRFRRSSSEQGLANRSHSHVLY